MLLTVEFLLHLRQCFLLSFLGDVPFELLAVNALLEHGDLVFIIVFDGVDHLLLLAVFLGLGFLELLLLLEQLVLLKIRGQLVDLLAHAHLLGVALEHLRALVVQHLLFKLFLLDSLDLLVTLDHLLHPLL